ncbi:Serine/threonine protein phosphatase, partial [Dysosmobacter welbionis]
GHQPGLQHRRCVLRPDGGDRRSGCGAGGRSGLHPGTLSGRRPGHQEWQQNRPACGGGRAAPAAGEGDLGAAVSELLELTPHRQGPPHTAEALFARSYRS